MHVTQHRFATLCSTILLLICATAAHAVERPGPCGQIVTACQQAGFTQGGARTGDGIQVDCVRPILLGTEQPRRATKPLPQVDPQVVEACKARNPNFGQPRNAPPADTPTPGGTPGAAPGAPPPRTGTDPTALAPAAPPPALPADAKRPNIVFILADDFSLDLVQYMPNLMKMRDNGATFANYFVTDSLCCPSRSSIFTGRYPHDTGIYRNTGQDGGYLGFVNRGHEGATFATALTAAGYHTAMLGKYLNGYQPTKHRVGTGWSEWDVAGNGYPGFNYDLNQNGKVVHYANQPTDYMTDVLSSAAVNFIKQQNVGTPFAIEIATFAPHAPYTPAPRDANALPGLRAPRSPAFNAAPDADAPKWLAGQRALSEIEVAMIDNDYRKRAQSVLAIDAMIGALQEAVAAIGATDNTYFVFSSDNGYHMGEHRMMPGKMTAYDTDIHVPLIVTGPGITAGRVVEEITQNIDLCPTFAELGYAAAPANVEGRSLVPLLHGEKVEAWRSVALIEHRGPVRNLVDPDLPSPRSGNPTTYEAIRMAGALYVEYSSGEKEYHDLATDPYELRNSYGALSADQKAALHTTLAAVQNCHDAAGCRAAERAERTAMRN